jgi:hypothetical protein
MVVIGDFLSEEQPEFRHAGRRAMAVHDYVARHADVPGDQKSSERLGI